MVWKRVKGNADRQDDVPGRRLVGDACRVHQRGEILKQKLAIFEEPQKAEIDDERQDQEQPPPRLGLRLMDPARRLPVDDGRDEEKNDERRIPRRVENIAGDKKVEFFDAPAERRAMQRNHNGEENDESQGVEKHAPPLIACWFGGRLADFGRKDKRPAMRRAAENS